MQNDMIVSIDPAYLYSVAGGDKEFEKILLETAVGDIQIQLEALQNAWQQQNADGVRIAAHTLKSVTAIAGAAHLENSCKTVEHLFSDGVFHPEAVNILDEITYGWKEAKPQLEALIAEY